MSSRGITRERQVRDVLRADDWWVARAAGSLGDADLIALKDGRPPMLIEVKSTARGPFSGFGPSDRYDLRVAARISGARAVLCWWPPRGRAKWYYDDMGEWPA